jgi:hypothetical protein
VRLRLSRVLLITAFALQVALCGLTVSDGASASAVPSLPSLHAPLANALSTAAGSWAVVAMGERGHPLSTFWQLFFRAPTPAAAWRLVTPSGVADNGGLTVAGAPTARLTVGFEPSQLLRYSPLALTLDDGASWTPGLVPASLAPAPDALAVQSGLTGTTTLALVRRGNGRVLYSRGPLGWHALSGGAALAEGSDARCDAEGLDAVAYDPSGIPLVGTGCRRTGQVGVFAHVGAGWKLIGPSLHGLAQATTKVLRLDSSGPLDTALVALNAPGRAGLLGLWRSAAGTWTASLPLTMGKAQTMLASAVGANGRQLVLLTTVGARGLLEQTAGAGQPWAGLPSPPAGTVTVALLGDGSIDAFSVNGTALRVFTLPAHGAAWSVSQRMTVPLSYGSS